jgi:hypothetical protein
MNNQNYYQNKISHYAQINNFNFNQYSEKIITKNLQITNLLQTDSGNGIIILSSPFIQRSATVSKDYLSGTIIVKGGASVQNGNINIFGEKNPINFFQSTVKAKTLISYEGIKIGKDLLTNYLEIQSNSSIIELKGTINQDQEIPIDLFKLNSLSGLFIKNELRGENLLTINNINISSINNSSLIFNKNKFNFNNISTDILSTNYINIDKIITNNLRIIKFDNLFGIITGNYINTDIIYDYQNIYANNIYVQEEITEIKNIPYANISISTKLTGDIITENFLTNSLQINNFANIYDTTTVSNTITTQYLYIDNLYLDNLNTSDITESSIFKNINHFGDVHIYNKFNIFGKTFSANVQTITYYDNMIPINLYDDNKLKDTGYQYNYLNGNIGIIFRKQFYNDNIIGNINNTFIIGRFTNNNNNIFSTIELLNIYTDGIYGNILSNTLALGITNNVFIGNNSYITFINGNINSNNAVLSNITISNLLTNYLSTTKIIQGNILYTNYLEGNIIITNINPNSLDYNNININRINSNIVNLSGNLIINSTLILTNGNMTINQLLSPNIVTTNYIYSNIINSKNIIADNILPNISNLNINSIIGNLIYSNLYISVNQINSNNDFYDYKIFKIFNNNYIKGNLFQTKIGDIQIFDQYYKKSYDTYLHSNINNINISSNNPIIKTMYNNKFFIMKNKNRSFHFNITNNIQNIQLNEQINYISSSYNGEVIGIDTIGNNIIYRYNYITNQYILINKFIKTSSLLNTKTIDINIDGNIIIISDPMFNNQSGNICIYNYNGMQYIIDKYITGNQNNRLGYNVSTYNNIIICSSPENGTYNIGGSNNGNVFVLDNNLLSIQIIKNISLNKQFGKNINLSNKNIIIADINNVYTYNYNNLLIGNISITGNINDINIDGSNNYLIINGNISNFVYKLRTNTIIFSSNNSLYNNYCTITGDGSYLYNFYNGFLTKYINNNGSFFIEQCYDTTIRGNSIINVTRNGNFLYIANNNGVVGNVYVYN